MLSIRTIDRALQSKDYDRLLRDLGQNGLVMPLPLRVQLAESPAGARGLGLRRLVELTYGPTALTREWIHKLIACQSPSGAVMDAAGRASCLLTAAFAAGLGRAMRDHGDRLGDSEGQVRGAYEQALSALSDMQQHDACFMGPQDRHPHDRLLTTAFIAYLLLDAPGFASQCRGHELLSVLEDQLDECPKETAQLIDMARLSRLSPAAMAPLPQQHTMFEPRQSQSPQHRSSERSGVEAIGRSDVRQKAWVTAAGTGVSGRREM